MNEKQYVSDLTKRTPGTCCYLSGWIKTHGYTPVEACLKAADREPHTLGPQGPQGPPWECSLCVSDPIKYKRDSNKKLNLRIKN